MPSDNCKRLSCHVCNPDGISFNPACKTCKGDGYLYFIGKRQVGKEEYREYYNNSVFAEYENSKEYCRICNVYIEEDNKSPEDGLCKRCHALLEEETSK